MLGLAISTVGFTALQTVANNSASLNNQYRNAVAKEAAQAGIAAAIACINSNNGTRVWGTAGTPAQETLTPLGCATNPTGTDDFIDDNGTYTSTYRVLPVEDVNDATSGRTTSIITAKGIVRIKGPGGAIVETIEKTARTQVQTNVASVGNPAKKNVVQVSTGYKTACAITDDDAIGDHWVYCWGNNSNAQLGNGRYLRDDRSTVPLPVYSSDVGQVAIPGTCVPFLWNPCYYRANPATTPAQPATAMANKNAVKVSVGMDHTCAIAQQGTDAATRRAYCWGRNDYGQLGDSSTTDSIIPVAVNVTSASSGLRNSNGTPKTVTDITAGNRFTCALTSDGLVSCWGNNDNGQLGNDTKTDSSTPVAVSMSTTPLPAQPRPCSYSIWGWDGQPNCIVWAAPGPAPAVPASALVGKQVQSLAQLKGTAATMCAITTEQKAVCWGQNFAGQLGDGNPRTTNHNGSGYDRHNNNGQCNTTNTNAFREAGGLQDVNYRDVSRPVDVQTSLLFKSITITASRTGGEPITSGYSSDGTKHSYVSAVTTSSSTNPNRSYYWGGSVDYDTSVTCVNNGGSYGSDSTTSTADITYTYSGVTSPAGALNQTGQSGGAAPLGFAAGSGYNGLFCATTNGDIYCEGHGTDTRQGQLGDGVVSSSTRTGPFRVSTNTARAADTSTTHGTDLTLGMAQTVIGIDTNPTGYTCLIANLSLLCWGSNDAGQLGTNSTSWRAAPAYVYTGDITSLGKPSNGGTGMGGVPASGIAAMGSSNGPIPNPTAARNF